VILPVTLIAAWLGFALMMAGIESFGNSQ